MHRRLVQWDLIKKGPNWAEIIPFAIQGGAVSLRILTFTSVIMYTSIILASVGTIAQAAHEINRQIWIVLIQVVESFNISNQSIMSSALYAGDLTYANAVCRRHMQLAASLVAIAASVVIVFRHSIVSVFTSDPSVMAMAMAPLVFLLVLLPFDAISTIMDGSLTAAGQAGWCAQTTIVMSMLTLGLFSVAVNNTTMTLLLTWIIMKFTGLLRLPILVHRTFFSDQSPFKPKPKAAVVV